MQTTPLPKLSIIVPVRDDERIFRLLASLSEAVELGSCEVMVACNGSQQDFVGRISSATGAIPFACVLTDSVANPARAINRAARIATGEKLLILDSDCVPCTGYLESLLATVSTHRVARGPITYVGTDTFSRTTAVWRQCFSGTIEKEGRLYAPNLAIERSLFLSLGGFVESLRHAYDSEFSDRAMRAGQTAVLLSAARVTHECHSSVITEMKIWFEYGCGRHHRMNGRRTMKAMWHALFGDLPVQSILSHPRLFAYASAYMPVRAAGFVYTALQGLVARKRSFVVGPQRERER